MDYLSFGDAKRQILQKMAETKGLRVEDMEPWDNYDPIIVDEEAYHLAKGSVGVRWTGD